MDWVGDNDENDSNFSWETDDDDDDKERPTNPYREVSEAGPSQPSLYSHFIGMGFSGDMVEKAIKENGEGNVETILETLLTYSAIGNSPSGPEDAPAECPVTSDEDSFEDDVWDTDDSNDKDFIEDLPEKEKKLLTLVDMGFSTEEAAAAIDRCGIASLTFDAAWCDMSTKKIDVVVALF
ncbi:DNA (cytosine-5)-methyltransferase DRM2-like [Phalaenopsis equestris]|uniref:DNA (cytosine-5)-methyltransferase DRM2-like n=1 Tax=Phalaenopsis equestris TaxID=78828 RepID=UPI0009E51D87|nr:DNA (cytosine-5)-methyltransferase DRM2-like [Phalaenopsis equestris]XP_020591525.1 DNA (cytosine-5)-methyltransferase DRM2-like [Phalaenopsis equestris]